MSTRVHVGGLRYVAQRLGLLALFSCLLFASAGRVNWVRGWSYVLIALVLELVNFIQAISVPSLERLPRRPSLGRRGHLFRQPSSPCSLSYGRTLKIRPSGMSSADTSSMHSERASAFFRWFGSCGLAQQLANAAPAGWAIGCDACPAVLAQKARLLSGACRCGRMQAATREEGRGQ